MLLGDADRERAIRQLRQAYEDGRLTDEELGLRAGRALAARTRTDLWWALQGVVPVVDLPRFVNAARTAARGAFLFGCWLFATGVIVFALMLDAVVGSPSALDALIFLGSWLLVTWLLWRAWESRRH